MNTAVQSSFITPEEYLRLENDRADDGERCEYNNGHVYAMAGASRTHNLLTMKLANRLFNHLQETPCEVFQSDMKVGIDVLGDTRFYYPDVQVSCAEEADDYVNTSPCLIIEVLSVSTTRKDRTEKWRGYRLIPSLQEYVLCSQDSPLVEVYRRRNEWSAEHYVSGQTLHLESVNLDIEIDELYSFWKTE